ncbi:HAD-IB family hydrolase [Paraburkholderia sp. D15]|uniref:HAD family hydrolase n=1 Tax=Paraburkholderia sp. D15 TaxID=2880218 RepID=UPI0024789596|nr:HAD-IB family hydrolase [Paraburkholderia sp. D15]WGS48836.1 HAD-IB family hydrolase [Paraburkholderia sp. D15]
MRLAFFDVDETLIDCKSMFVFAKFYFDEYLPPGRAPTYDELMGQIQQQVRDGAPRETINAFYYSRFAGRARTEVRHAARALFDARPYPQRQASVARLRAHQQAGDEVVFVSGAMVDILHPLMTLLDVRSAYCSAPAVRDGIYTGALTQQAIGAGKAQAVAHFCAQRDVPPERCFAYGDHVTDVPLLSAVGHAVAVNPDAPMAALARDKGWEIIA